MRNERQTFGEWIYGYFLLGVLLVIPVLIWAFITNFIIFSFIVIFGGWIIWIIKIAFFERNKKSDYGDREWGEGDGTE